VVVLRRALTHLAEASRHLTALDRVSAEVEANLHRAAASIEPRRDFRLIHGELGPDHVLVDAAGHSTVIDIEGLMFFDIEWEHAFLQLRFGTRYEPLHRRDLDPARMELYSLALYLSLCAGPLRLLQGNFPLRDAMQAIINANLARVLRHLQGTA
jgi:hypothetical protein